MLMGDGIRALLRTLFLALSLFARAVAGESSAASDLPRACQFLPILRQPAGVETTAHSAGSAASVAQLRAPVRNIIVMIGDGRGFNHVQAANLYQHGASDQRGAQARQECDRFPVHFAMSTYAHGCSYDPDQAWSEWEYLTDCETDSAAAATAMASGIKTYNDAIGVDVDGNPVPNALELAEQKDMATGLVTSVPWTHATPAAHVAHNVHRDNYEEIGREIVNASAADVVMGAGHPWYDHNGLMRETPDSFDYVGGEATWDALVAGTAGGDANGDGDADPWTLVQTRAEIQSLISGPTPGRVLATAQVRETLQQGRGGDFFADPFVEPRIESVPTLTEMALAAINILDDDPDGLYLMVEGGAIDWASHVNQSGRMIEEEIEFEQAVEAVIEWVEANSNWGETLLIVTGDHETGYLWGPGSNPTWAPIVDNGAGNLPGMAWNSFGHTNSLIPFEAMGLAAWLFYPRADQMDPVYGRYLDNTDVAKVIFAVLNQR